MYKSLILPHFDYADVIWDNCAYNQSKMIKDLHLESIRIIGAELGIPFFVVVQEVFCKCTSATPY